VNSVLGEHDPFASRMTQRVGTSRQTSVAGRMTLIFVIMLTTIVSVGGSFAQPRSTAAQDDQSAVPVFGSQWAAPTTVYIPDTGHTIDGLFLDMWRENGSASVFGNPITDEITRDDGSIVQYYDFARFEYWPNGDVNGNQITLGHIGEDLRPAVVPRMPIGGKSGKAAQLTRVAMAWEPLGDRQIRADSDTYLYVPETGHSINDGFLAFWQNNSLEWFLGNPVSEEYVVDSVHYQVFERGQLRWKDGEDITMVPVGEKLAEQQQLSQAPSGQGDVPVYDESLFVPPAPPTVDEVIADTGAKADGERWIDVSLTNEYLTAYQGNTVILETYISSGKPGFETPTGTFFINSKLPEQDMEGVIGGEYYDVPSVPDVMYFTDFGHAIHGTYWHNNFGNPMSHGCINVPLDLAHFLYEWAPINTRVEIHY
jgi:hypothetical protein